MHALFIAAFALAQAGATEGVEGVVEVVALPPTDGACEWSDDVLRVRIPGFPLGTAGAMIENAVVRGWHRLATCLRVRARGERAIPTDGRPLHDPLLDVIVNARVVSYSSDGSDGHGIVVLALPIMFDFWGAACRAP